jgi:sulfite reductase alpha subunit-like flavoprotein
MEQKERSVAILYGTETGNSQDFAELVARKCRRLRMKEVFVNEMDRVSLTQLLEYPVVIFIVSTTGQGELPRNALKLWKQLLRKKLPPTFLSGVKFTTFGLGDSSYPRFNWAIRKIHKRLLQLGGDELALRGEGDEQSTDNGGAEANFDAWLAIVTQRLLEEFPLPEGVVQIPENELLSPRFKLTVDENRPKKHGDLIKDLGMTRTGVCKGEVVSNERMTAKDHFQDVRHLVFNTEEADMHYEPGDTVALYPQNNYEEVELLIKHQGWTDIADCRITVNEEFADSVPGGLVSPLTLRSLILYHLDINAIPRRSFFTVAWHFSFDSEREQERLQEFAELDGLDDLYDYANRPRRSILETILEFDSLKIPPEYVLDLMPILRPRLFSIASPSPSPGEKGQHTTFELAIAIVKYKTILRRIRRGACTRWVEKLRTDEPVPFTLHKSPLPLPGENGRGPAVMVAPGTGVAPMRSLVFTKLRDQSPPQMRLFFGCRNAQKDFLFDNDWRTATSQPPGSDHFKIVTAFSRDEGGGGYAQNQLFAHRKTIVDLIVRDNGYFYVCGSSGAMPRQVRITLVEIIREHLDCSEHDAEAYVHKMENSGRYVQETW